MLQFEIAFPLRGKHEGQTWRITEPFLKLALKYGMLGKWLHNPWAQFNPSVAFDAYSVTRGPARGLPDLGDFAATMMMGSGVDGGDLPRFLRWLALPETVQNLEAVRQALLQSAGLHDSKRPAEPVLASVVTFGTRLTSPVSWRSHPCPEASPVIPARNSTGES